MYLFERLFMSVLAEVLNEDIFSRIPGWTEEAQGKTVDEMRRLFAEQFRDLLLHTPDPDKAMTIEHPKYGHLGTHFSDIRRHVVNHGTYHRVNVTRDAKAARGIQGSRLIICSIFHNLIFINKGISLVLSK
ncbi:hypothetical protein ACFVQB_10355 [Paenibacillus sp. NPDC057886]|uniref:hypothetical protein n=1 Tax=Paenibacillus sp. NPDC057886 TaxID=3346270 RepID=UPI00368BA9C6